MAELTLDHISKTYPGHARARSGHALTSPDHARRDAPPKAVDDISFTVKDKEFMVIVGPSGCGKSTLLRMIAGLEDISEGVLSIDGKRINELSPADRDIAMVFQNYALYPHMTVYENLAFGLKLKRISKTEIRSRVTQTAELLEIQDMLPRKPRLLSGGQRQRVAIGRAIIRRPKIFLFDEPLSNLDAKLRTQMRIELQKLHRKISATIVYVTHDQTEAMTLGDRIAVLNKGSLMQLDTPMNLYKTPVNKFVAGFIGSPSMNFLKGSSENIILGIRPEHILITSPGDTSDQIDPPALTHPSNHNDPSTHPSGHNDAPARTCEVIAVENMGNEQLIYLSLDGQTVIARRPPLESISAGATVGIRFIPDQIYHLDEETGLVINAPDC
ncbi:MAG TPA: sn-glycerol-3-phosphate ABC transporter ATP-binding protein UgpC [Puia sp.]|nr:sn-glycerol-3-phosphate ABC transporter ATP-binding protein UgpC [Puia sp.]